MFNRREYYKYNTGHNQPAFIKAAYNCKTIDIAMPFFMQISGIVFMSPLKMVSKTMNKKGNIALFYFAAPSSAAVLTFYKISCFFTLQHIWHIE